MAESSQSGNNQRKHSKKKYSKKSSRQHYNKKQSNNKQHPNKRNHQEKSKNGNSKRQKLTLWQRILSWFGILPKKKVTAKKAAKKTPPQPRERKPIPVTSNKLYLGNLSFDTTEYDLEDLFKGIGAVQSVEIIYNRHTHKSKGYGFVTMRRVEDAKRAVEVLNEQLFMGRKMSISGAKPKTKIPKKAAE